MAAAAAAAPVAVPPSPARWVTDGAGFLSPEVRDRLDRRLEAYQGRTGHQVIVWIGTTIGDESLEPWAARAFAAWGIGRKGHDDGAALFILAQDRKMRIEVGYGLEGQLTDLASARIIREEMVPLLRARNPDGAVIAAVNGILGTLGGEAPEADRAVPGEPPARRLSLGEIIVLGVVLLLFLGFVATHPSLALALLYTLSSTSRRGGGWSGGGGFSSGGSWGGGGGGFSGGGGRSGGGGASGSW